MRTRLGMALVAALALTLPARAQDGSAPDRGVSPPAGFERGSAAHLAALCAAVPANPRFNEATGLCNGFLVGVGQYHAALHPPGSAQPPLFCLPDPPPTLRQVATGFSDWVRANPQHAAERAVDGLARWARATYPCPAPAPAPARRR